MKHLTHKSLLASLLLVLLPLTGMARQEVLPPDEVFRYAVSAAADKVTVSWNIEPGYYLYQGRMSYAFEDAGIELGEPLWPEGEMHSDEFFGVGIARSGSRKKRLTGFLELPGLH